MSLLLAVLLLAASVDEGLPLETVPQLGHAKSIDAMAYSADGRYFVSADQERALVWEVRSGRLLRAIRHAGMMRRDRGAALTADGARLFVGGNVYDVRTGKLLHHLEGATIATSDGLTAAGLGGIFDTASGQRVKAFPRVSECADPMVTDVTADRKLLAVHCMATSGQTSFFVRVVDADTGAKVVQPYEGRPIYNGLNVGIFSPNGKFLVTVGHTPDSPNNDHASVVEIASGKLLADISSTASSVSFRAGTQQLILFGTNLREGVQQVEAYDLRAPRDPVWKLQSLQLIETGAVSPDGEAILFGGTDKLVHRAQASTGAEVATRSGAIEDVQQLAFLADGTLAVQTQASWTSQRGSLRLWDLAGARQTEVLEANGLTLLDGGRVALARGQPLDQPLERTAPIATRLIELPSLRDRFSRPFTPQTGLRAEGAAVLSPHGKYLFVLDRSNDKGSFAMLDAKTGAELMTLPKREASYDLIGVDEAEKTAFVRAPLETAKDGNSREQEYLLIDLASTRVVRRYPRAQLDCGALVLPTPDGAYWALEQGSGNGSERFLLVIDSATGSIREVHPKTAFGVVPRFTQDHLLFFTTGLDKKGEMVRLHALDLESLKERWALKLGYEMAKVDGRGGHLWVTELMNVNGEDHAQVHLVDAQSGRDKALFKTREEPSLRFSQDGSLVAVRADLEDGRQTTLVYEVATGRQVVDLHAWPMGFAAAFSADKKQLAVVDPNGNVAVHELPSGKVQATLLALRDREWAVSAPDGSYAASKGATRSVHFVRGMKIYTFENFDLRFNRPDKLLAALGRAGADAIESSNRAWQKRVKRMGFLPSEIGQDLHLPEVEIPGAFTVNEVLAGSLGESVGVKKGDTLRAIDGKTFATLAQVLAYLGPKRKYELTLVRDGAPLTVVADKQGERLGLSLRLVPVLPPETAERQVAFDVKASDDEIALDRLNVYVNEVPIFGLRGRKLEGKEALAHVDAPLLPGRNLVQVSVTNAKGAESLRESYEVTCKAPPRPSKVVLLAVGVSQYADARMNLTYAAKDAQDLAALLTAHGGNVQVVPVLDTAATREGILAAKQQLLATAPEDEVIVFYAGHGLLDEKLDYFLATTDVDYEHPAAKGLPYEELEGLVDGVPALRRLVLVDACHSGEVDKDEATLAAANLSAGPVKSRGLKVVARKHLGVKSAADLAAELFADLRRGSGAAVIASASGTEVAFESSEWNNGVFTYALLEGLRAGKTHVSELRDYTSARVKELTHGQQTPTARRENLEFDFSVW